MEFELENKIFLLEEYTNKIDMEEAIKEYIRKLKENYPRAIITREFYRRNAILVRATEINNKAAENQKEDRQNELEIEEIRIKEKGINGLGENVNRTNRDGKSKEREFGYSGGNERER